MLTHINTNTGASAQCTAPSEKFLLSQTDGEWKENKEIEVGQSNLSTETDIASSLYIVPPFVPYRPKTAKEEKDTDLQMSWRAIVSPGANKFAGKFLKKILAILYFGETLFRNIKNEWVRPMKMPTASILCHGSRVLIECVNQTLHNQVMDWLFHRQNRRDYSRYSSTHSAELCQEGKNQKIRMKEIKLNPLAAAADVSRSFLFLTPNTLHYGVDIPLGGVGNQHPSSGNVIENNGEFGQCYLGSIVPEAKVALDTNALPTAILVGLEHSAPGKRNQFNTYHGPAGTHLSISPTCTPNFTEGSKLDDIGPGFYHDSIRVELTTQKFEYIRQWYKYITKDFLQTPPIAVTQKKERNGFLALIQRKRKRCARSVSTFCFEARQLSPIIKLKYFQLKWYFCLRAYLLHAISQANFFPLTTGIPIYISSTQWLICDGLLSYSSSMAIIPYSAARPVAPFPIPVASLSSTQRLPNFTSNHINFYDQPYEHLDRVLMEETLNETQSNVSGVAYDPEGMQGIIQNYDTLQQSNNMNKLVTALNREEEKFIGMPLSTPRLSQAQRIQQSLSYTPQIQHREKLSNQGRLFTPWWVYATLGAALTFACVATMGIGLAIGLTVAGAALVTAMGKGIEKLTQCGNPSDDREYSALEQKDLLSPIQVSVRGLSPRSSTPVPEEKNQVYYSAINRSVLFRPKSAPPLVKEQKTALDNRLTRLIVG